jgi:hypothetical protein
MSAGQIEEEGKLELTITVNWRREDRQHRHDAIGNAEPRRLPLGLKCEFATCEGQANSPAATRDCGQRATAAILAIAGNGKPKLNVAFRMYCSQVVPFATLADSNSARFICFAAHSLSGSLVSSSASPPPSVSRVSSPLVSSSGSPLGLSDSPSGTSLFFISSVVRLRVAFRLSLSRGRGRDLPHHRG